MIMWLPTMDMSVVMNSVGFCHSANIYHYQQQHLCYMDCFVSLPSYLPSSSCFIRVFRSMFRQSFFLIISICSFHFYLGTFISSLTPYIQYLTCLECLHSQFFPLLLYILLHISRTSFWNTMVCFQSLWSCTIQQNWDNHGFIKFIFNIWSHFVVWRSTDDSTHTRAWNLIFVYFIVYIPSFHNL